MKIKGTTYFGHYDNGHISVFAVWPLICPISTKSFQSVSEIFLLADPLIGLYCFYHILHTSTFVIFPHFFLRFGALRCLEDAGFESRLDAMLFSSTLFSKITKAVCSYFVFIIVVVRTHCIPPIRLQTKDEQSWAERHSSLTIQVWP